MESGPIAIHLTDGIKAIAGGSEAVRWTLRAEYEELGRKLESLRDRAFHLSGQRTRTFHPSHVFDTLPTEIIAEILILASYMGSSLEQYEFPVVNQFVCRRWRQIIRQAPRLWSHFDNTSSSKHHAFRLRLRRAGVLPLDIMVTVIDVDHLSSVLKPFRSVTSRWKSLAIELGCPAPVSKIMIHLPNGTENLENFAIIQPSQSMISFLPSLPVSSLQSYSFPFGQVKRLHLYYTPLAFEPALFHGGMVEELVIHGWHHSGWARAGQDFIGALRVLISLRCLEVSGLLGSLSGPLCHSSPRTRVDLPHLDSLTLRNMPHASALRLIYALNASNLQCLVLDCLHWSGSVDVEPQDGHVGWDFPHLTTLHLLQTALIPELWIYCLSTLTAVRHLKFTTSRAYTDVFAPFLDSSLFGMFGENLVSLTTRRVWLPSLRYFVRNLAVHLQCLKVHVEDLTMEYGVHYSAARRLEEEVQELREEIDFVVDYVYDEQGEPIPTEKRFANWREREEWNPSAFN